MKSANINEGEKIGIYNHNNKWIQLVSGYGESRTPIYVGYIVFVLVVNVCTLILAIWALVLVIVDKILIVLAAHVVFTTIFCGNLTIGRLLTDSSLKETDSMIMSGIFDYEDEEIDENQSNMKKEIDAEIKKTCDLVVIGFGSGAVSNFIVFPLTQLMLHDGSYQEGILNPYLPPLFFYLPFETRTAFGYCLAYFIIGLSGIIMYCQVISFLIVYIQTATHLRGQLQILNYSMKQLHIRANSKLKRLKLNRNYTQELILENEDFQSCIYSCFKDNIKHHQTLLRYKACMQPFNGACLLGCYVMIALIFASLFYIILQKMAVGFLINFLEMLFTEQSALFLICFIGEKITEEHEKLFETVYDLKWVGCSKKVTNGFRIMMSNTIQPFYLKALLIDSTAALKSYGEFMMAMYKIVNLVRQSGVVQ